MPDDPGERWKPSRAGILNVYQYQDEVLEFAGGRLLLRGVNGSGKSTAMNMLLPFLLEADVRKIDAAGEQRGVLRSWMLSDHDDTQRTGYLWIEFERSGEYRTVGCGIRANRSTDRVAVWWFSTDRRVRIDLRLTEADVPFSIDVLRSELGTRGQVFTSTAEYRAEVARRFFGGVDPTAYFRLLHQVRNPRVGDRIDTDLPRTLREALPPVPEDAVHDAAQPLEDLEDHRRNVTDLARTAEALDGAVEVYTDYARRVLMTEVESVATALDIARAGARRVDRDRGGVDKATAARDAAVGAVGDLTDEHAEATAERAGLAALPEYTAHADLVRRRDEVARADAHVATLDGHRTRARERVVAAAGAVGTARGQLDSDLAGIAEHLRTVADAARAASAPGVVAQLPDPPAPATEPRRDDAGETTVEVPSEDHDLAGDLDLTAVGDALRAHRTTVREVAEHARGARRATEAADAAETSASEAQTAHEAAAEQAAAARRAARAAADEHAEAVAGWTRRLAEHATAVPAAEPGGPTGWLAVPSVDEPASDDDLRRAADRRRTAARGAADDVTGALERAGTRAGARVEEIDEELAGLRAEHERVSSAGELPLPRAPWQRDDDVADGDLLASLVDFREHLDDAERAGLEAALEASGLLTAHVDGATGTVRVGGLVVTGSDPAPGPGLDTLLAPVDTGAVPLSAISGVLAAVGVEAGPVRVATDGTFAAGPLRGRHAKPAAEHVGAGARAQARERRLAELAAAIADAQSRRDAAGTVADALAAHTEGLRRLVAELPGTRGVDDAVAAATGAVRYAEGAEARHRELATAATDARRRADEAWASLSRSAGEAGVPTDPDRLDGLLEAVVDAERALAAVDAARDRVVRTARAWREAITAWERDAADHATAVGEHRDASARAASVRTELTTIEESLGEEPAKVAARVGELDDRLRSLAARLEEAREQQTAAAVALSKAEMTLEETRRALEDKQHAARSARGRLADAAAVPGLLAAAEPVHDPEDEDAAPEPLPSVADTVEGAEELVAALRARLPAPRKPVSEDALEKALRGARDELASGWDIESRRSADGMPLAVHVSGPSRAVLAQMVHRVAVQRRRATSLLSAQQDQALRNLLHGRIAREVADALFAARELVDRMNRILQGVTSSQGIGVRLDWRPRGDLDPSTATALELLGVHPDLRSADQDDQVREAVKSLVEAARVHDPEASYRSVIGEVLDYRTWHEMRLYLRRPGRSDELLTRRTTLSEGEKKLVTVLPMAAAAAASAAAHDPHGVGAPRLVLLDDAFAKVSEDNHAKLFGLLVDLDVDFVVTSERLWGTHPTVPALAITEVLRDPELRAIALVHYRWDGAALEVRA